MQIEYKNYTDNKRHHPLNEDVQRKIGAIKVYLYVQISIKC